MGKPVINELLEIEKQEPNIYNKNVKKAIHVLTAHEANKNPNKKGLMPTDASNKPIIKLNNNNNNYCNNGIISNNNNNKEFRIYHDDENNMNIGNNNNNMMMEEEEDNNIGIGIGRNISNNITNRTGNWNSLNSHDERMKENIVNKSKWNDIKIVQNNKCKSNNEKKCSFQIYRDDDNNEELKVNNIRRKLEYPIDRRANGLEEENDDEEDDMTVNTKKAFEELSDLYSTPKWCLKKPPKPFITPYPISKDKNKELLMKLSSEVLKKVEK